MIEQRGTVAAVDSPREPWQVLADAEVVEAMDEDTGELIEIAPGRASPGIAEGLLIRFRYVDAGGSPSTRVVLGWRAWCDGQAVLLRGACTLRGAMRTFRADRMSDVVELRTARAVDDPDLYLADYLDEADRAAFDRARGFRENARLRVVVADAKSVCRSGMRILAYIAMADGERSLGEAEAERGFVVERMAMEGAQLPDAAVEKLVNYAQSLAPTREAFLTAVRDVAEHAEELALVCRTALDMARHDGIAPAEAEALQALITSARRKRAKAGIGASEP